MSSSTDDLPFLFVCLFVCFFNADINECVNDDLFNCTDEFHICVNTRGSYKCECGQNLYFIDGKCRGNIPVQR